SQGPGGARHSVQRGVYVTSGQAALEPVQVSARSHGPAAARQTVPALPAGCGHAALTPSHWSAVQAFPSSVQAVPAGFLVSSGQLGPLPVQSSATSHSSAAARHCVVPGAKASVGHVLLTPSQVSATSQGPAAGRHVVPSGLLASVGQLVLVPVQVSAGSQTPAVARQMVPAASLASAGQVALEPVQTSGTSQAPPEVRQTVPEATNVQLVLQHAPPSHCSPGSTTPLPQFSL